MVQRILALCVVVVIAGCNASDSTPLPTSAHVPPEIGLPPGFSFEPETTANDTNLIVAKFSEIETRIKKQQGKIVVAQIGESGSKSGSDVRDEIVKIHKEHAAEGVVCLLILTDGIANRDAVTKAIRIKEANFDRILIEDAAALKWVDIAKLGPYPAIVVFGRDGQVAQRFIGSAEKPLNFNDVSKLIHDLLKK